MPGQYPPGSIRPDSIRRVSIPARPPRIPGQTSPTADRAAGNPNRIAAASDRTPTRSLLTTTAGILRRVAPNQLVIQPDDHRIVWYRLAPQIKVQKDGKDADLREFALGDYLSVDSNSDDDSIMTAVSVTWKKAGTPDDRAEASKTWDLPRSETVARGSTPSQVPIRRLRRRPREADDDRPVLRRKDPEPLRPRKTSS